MDRCIKLAKTVTDTGLIELDQGASTRAGKFLSFDSSGDLAGSTTFGTNKGEWTTSTVYVIGDTVYDGTNGASTYNVYTCSEDHTSGVWATDLAAPKWTLSINVATITTAALAAQTAAEAAQAYAEEWANKAEDSLISAAAGGDEVDDYSALHFDAILTAADAVSTAADLVLTNADVVSTNADVVLTGLDVDATNADVVSTNADVVSTNADVVLASQWATLLDALVAATDYSAKEWAIGTTVPSGSAKDWAVVLAAMVDGADYSAKEYAIGTTVAAGSAKEWAITVEDTLVDGASYSALHHAAKAAASAAAAAATLADAVTVTGANEISGVAEKAAPVYADIVLIEDSEASYVKKKVQMSNMLGGDIHQGNDPPATTQAGKMWLDLDENSQALVDAEAIHEDVDGEINAISEKTTPVGADIVIIEDSAASYAKKSLKLSNVVPFQIPGFVQRPKFEYKDADEIYINAGAYHHDGTTEQIVYWNSQLTIAGTFSGTDWYYLYLDDSAIVTAGTNLLTASEFIFSTTEPTWSHTKHGWYNGNDRCIFAVYSSSGSIYKFYHDADSVVYDVALNNLTLTDIDTWTDVTLTIPAFATRASGIFEFEAGSQNTYSYWRPNGSSGAGHLIGTGSVTVSGACINTVMVIADSTQKIEVNPAASGGAKIGVDTAGWYLPSGV
jgi:hypothetical protein